VLLALGSSLAWGVSAFVAGRRGRDVPTALLLAASQALGIPVLVVLMVASGAAAPTSRGLAAGAVAGIGTIAGLGALYRGLAVARMAVVAPLAAIVSVAVPTVVDVARGTPLTPTTAGGLVLGALAAGLLSGPRTSRVDSAERSGLGHGLVSGLGFATFSLGLDASGADAGLWPLLAARGSTVAVLAVVIALQHVALRTALREGATPIAMIGTLEIVGALLYLVALRVGPLSVVVVLAALYPGVTVLLARVVLGQRLGRVGVAGLVAAAVAVVLLVGG
jgi:drug/metabolite transporter (DMT)-like permease